MRHPPLKAQFFVQPDGVAIVRERSGYISYKMRKAVFERDGHRCRICDRDVVFFTPKYWDHRDPKTVGHVDHIIPRSRGGQTTMSNLRLLCERCNLSKCAD